MKQLITARCVGLSVGIAAMTLLGGCGSEGDTIGMRSDGVTEGDAARDLGEKFTDAHGRKWIRTQRDLEYVDAPNEEINRSQRPSEPELKLTEMPFEDAVEALRPFMEYGGSEYTLSDDDARTAAAEILDVIRNPDDYPTFAAPTPGEEEGVSEDLGEVQGKHGINGSNNDLTASSPTAGFNEMTGSMSGAATCTTFKLINKHTAVTAGHCLHTGSSWKTRLSIQFGGQASLGSSCYTRTVPGCWDGDSGSECDYGVLAFRGNGGVCTESRYDVGNYGWAAVNDDDDNMNGTTQGYPNDHMKSSWTYPEFVSHTTGGGYSSFWDVEIVFYDNDQAGGMSGGPYMNAGGTGIVRAIQTASWDDSENMGRSMRSSLVSWLTSNGGS